MPTGTHCASGGPKATAALRGEGEGEATNIYAKAFGQDPRSSHLAQLQGYRIFEIGAARLVVSRTTTT
jgi:hypothetical protein